MKNIFLSILIITFVSCKAQTYPLRTFTELPENSYLKDTNNELPAYEGVWKGQWNNKIIYVTINKVTNKFNETFKNYSDRLIARFKVTDLNGLILFDNTNLSDYEVKIEGIKFKKSDDKYTLVYVDRDLCMRSGTILINFTDTTKTKLQWKYWQDENWVDKDCFYHGWAQDQRPQPLPNDIILIKQ
ncbi:DUF6705 family protein [uncultured Chryseobacterium sp.]|jgi:hypothetical protein|uniref:DUF6705 family protein n=1 Tax=uncultured Chryseobacterium sp. TaxID=259322 RepID=UPI00260C4CC7|nr:DUF6705 family protein [uncultured Chryseobacterium sp.]